MLLRRCLFLTLAAAFLVSGLGAFEAHAGSVNLPVALDPGLTTTVLSTPAVIIATSNGNTTTVNGAESLTFSDFSYSATATGSATSYPATSVAVLQYTTGNETGISFNAGWSAPSGGTLDLAISYTVSAPQGQKLTDAFLAITGSVGGTGYGTVGETLLSGTNTIGSLTASIPGPRSDLLLFPCGYQSITVNVSKDVYLSGGTGYATISIVDQAFSSCGDPTAVPEPTTIALLGIGMAGFFSYRRLFKRAAAAV
jgi:PEP-CTERM motif